MLRLFLLLLLVVSGFGMAPTCAQPLQITGGNTPPFTPDNLIRNVFLGEGVEVTNVLFKGKPVAVGYFTGGTASIGLERGIIMTTGSAKNAIGNGNAQNDLDNGSSAFDFDLNGIATAPMRNLAVYEITFIPTADTLRFRYCFGSEEYPEFACKTFNDVFAFFIQGPGYPVPTNIARIPGTNLEVSINTLHPAYAPNNCAAANAQYYNSNLNQTKQPIYDGFTDVFTAEAIVTPCQAYTIKLAIADVGDEIFDSGVFLEAKSFGTGSLKVELTTVSADATIAEGCSPATLTFSLPKALSQNFPIDFNLGGTALQGVDYQNLPPTLVIPAGQTSITLPVTALFDNLPETGEYIALDVQRDPCNRDTLLIYLRDNALAPPNLPPDTTFCVENAQPLLLDATLPIPTPPAPVFSNTADFAIPDDDNQGVAVPIQVFGVQPVNLSPGVIRSVCLNATHPWVDDFDFYLISPGGQILELTTDNGQNGMNYTATCFTPTATKIISAPGPFAPASAAPFTGDWLPEGPWSDLWDGTYPTNGTWKLQATDDQVTFSGTLLDWAITFEPSYKINYQWSPAAGLDCATCPQVTASPTQTTLYTLTASDSYGCTTTDQITISPQTELPPPTVTCGNETTNSLTFNWNAISGATQYEVNLNGSGWVPASATLSHTVSPVLPGTSLTLQVRAISTTTCPAQIGLATCTKCASPAAQVTPTPPDCAGTPTGKILVSVVSPANPPYLFALANQANTTGLFTDLPAGIYTITVTDGKGCSATILSTLQDPPALQLSASTTPATCFEGQNGNATAQASGGNGGYQFLWNTGQTTAQISGLPAGTYTVTVRDTKGCTATQATLVSQPTALQADVSSTAAACFGEKTGQLQAQGIGGTPAYTFAWDGPDAYTSQSPNPAQLAAGTYTLTLTDAAGCTLTRTTQVSQPAAPLTLILPQTADTVCFAAGDGAATAAATGGTSPYTWLWSAANQTTATATALPAGQYRVTATDANGCTATAQTSILEKLALSLSVASTPPRCFGGHDGTATVQAAAYGPLPADLATLTYQWSSQPAQVTRTALSLSANTLYTVTATDAGGCTATQTATIGNAQPFGATAQALSAAPCFGESGGTALATGTGGTAPYTFRWSQGDSTAQANHLAAGIYQITLTDAAGCTATASVSITQPSPLRSSTTSAPARCFGENSGSATAVATGGTAPYAYLWTTNGGVQQPHIAGLAAGMYFVSITDANGCRTVDSVRVGQPAATLSGTVQVTDATCHGVHNGKIQVTATGGTPPYRYALDQEAWSGSSLQFALGAGVYVPRLQDQQGCTAQLSAVLVHQRPPVLVDAGPDLSIELGESVQLQALISQATPPYQITWAPADQPWLSCLTCADPVVDGLLFGRFFAVTVTDSAGCTGRDQVHVQVRKERRVYVPTGFSPNGDGSNDRLWPMGQEGVQVLQFQVYDRWGELVFQADGDFALNLPERGWDGVFRDSEALAGVYVWVLEVRYLDGAQERLQGESMLIR